MAIARVLERFAEAFSLGYARHLDFRRLEEQRRNAEIERALASVQAFVQGMKSSTDIVRFITILSNELESAGMDFTTCAISFLPVLGLTFDNAMGNCWRKFLIGKSPWSAM